MTLARMDKLVKKLMSNPATKTHRSPWYSWNIVKSGIKTPKINHQNQLYYYKNSNKRSKYIIYIFVYLIIIGCYLQLFVEWLMSYLRYICLFAYSGFQHTLCCTFCFVCLRLVCTNITSFSAMSILDCLVVVL